MSKQEIEQTVDKMIEQEPPPEEPRPDQLDLGATGPPTHYEDVPERILAGIVAFVLQGRPTGGFLKAVLSNDLYQAVGRADLASYRALSNIIRFLYNHCPPNCYGSPTKVEDWISMGGLEGSGQSWDFERGEMRR